MSLTAKARQIIKPLATIQFRGVKAKAPREKVGPTIYVPPPNCNPQLVREESVIKSLVLEDAKFPICLKRLDEIHKSPKGWVGRKVPPPELPFEIKRNSARNFNIETNQVRLKGCMSSYTIVTGVKGDLKAFKDCLKWRLGEKTFVKIDEKRQTVVVGGHYPKQISMLIQALGF